MKKALLRIEFTETCIEDGLSLDEFSKQFLITFGTIDQACIDLFKRLLKNQCA